MARAAADKAYTNFSQGFVTEATGLTYPENSVRQIDNVDLNTDGSARRRLGVDQEPNGYTIGLASYANTTFSGSSGYYSKELLSPVTIPANELAVTSHIWENPGAVPGLQFIVFQIGNKLFIRRYDNDPISDPSAIVAVASGLTTFNLDFPTNGVVYNTTADVAAKSRLSGASGFGRLWLTSKAHFPFYLEYDAKSKAISARPVGYSANSPNGKLEIRDFNGVDDGLKVDAQPPSLSKEHLYNLLNQAWPAEGSQTPAQTQEPEDLVQEFYDRTGAYPSNGMVWWVAKQLGPDGEYYDFIASLLTSSSFGNSPAPKGTLIMDALIGSRDGIAKHTNPVHPSPLDFNGEYDEKAATSFRAIAFNSGRVWFAGESNEKRPNGVYFSKVLSKVEHAGTLMQVNDPTSEEFPDLLATDGGVIYIPEAAEIKALAPYKAGMVVFARNGVWYIYGGENEGFAADKFAIEKISETGISSGDAVVIAENLIAYWSIDSISLLQLPEQGIVPVVTDIAVGKIHSFLNKIDSQARDYVRGCYDGTSKKIFWTYLEQDDYSYPRYQTGFNRMLVFDLRLGAFTKYSFTVNTEPGTSFLIGDVFPKRTRTIPQIIEPVTTDMGEQVVDNSSDPVNLYAIAGQRDTFVNAVKMLVLDETVGGVFVAEFINLDYQDFATMPNGGPQDYESYIQVGDETLGDLQRVKQATWLHSFFRRTETGFVPDATGALIADNPSGCYAQARWDWTDTSSANRWSDPQKVYRYRRPYTPIDSSDSFDNGREILYTKVKIRGRGRALSVRFSSEPRKNFILLGYSIAYTANGV